MTIQTPLRRLRVLHIVPALFSRESGVVGGAERYALELAKAMSEETHTTLLTFGPESRTLKMGNLEVIQMKITWLVKGQANNPFNPAIVKEIQKCDVLHCHQEHILTTTYAALIGRVLGKRVFVSDLGGGGWDISAYVSTKSLFHAELHISKYSASLSSAPESKKEVIYGGVDTDKFSPNPSVPRSNSVLFVGRLLAHKGIDVLIQAMPSHIPLKVIGSAYDDKYFSKLRQLAEGRNVTFSTSSNDEELVHAYRSCRVVVLPSLYKDCYGNTTNVPELLGQTLLEGAACGAPCICTNVASMPEIVIPEQTGFIVPPNQPDLLQEKINWLMNHNDAAQKLGEQGRQLIMNRFTWGKTVNKCLEYYQPSKLL